MAQHWINRQRVGRGFKYYWQENEVTNEEELNYFKSLAIPPAWKQVKIAKNKQATILATGKDEAGRTQYIYNPTFRQKQELAKYERILHFAQALPQLRKTISRHLARPKLDREKVLATVVQLIDQAYFRVGNDSYARDHGSFGITTLRSRHLRIKGDAITFDFMGKSGQQQSKRVNSRKLARIIKRLDELPGYEVFKYYDEDGNLKDVKSADVNAYIKEYMGEDFSAKDFRTWGGTLYATTELIAAHRHPTSSRRKQVVTKCVKRVAKKLGNTPAVARKSYIDPRVIDAFENDSLSSIKQTVQKMRRSSQLSQDEKCVLVALESKN